MNHIYRSIWSDALRTWVAVSENTKGKAKSSSKSNTLLATGLLLCSSSSWALPTGEQLVAGQATVTTPNAGQLQIDQTSQHAIVNWQGFSIAPNEAVNIQQPNAQAALLNRVVGQDASQIQGQLNANGQVYLVNPNGVVFSKTAQVDVGGLVASTHNIKDADFMNGNQHFTQDSATGTVENHGTIKTPEGGVVALIGTQVSNDGTIETPKGTTALAAGKTVDLDFKGDGLIEVKVTEAALKAQIDNKGAIQADGGRVVLTAKSAGQLIDTVINQEGIVRAQGLVERNGEIILDGGDNGVTQVSGTLDADSQQTGGKISVTGKQVQINNNAIVTASGDAGGGAIIIGDKQTTSQTTIEQGASITAQARNHGNAGKIDVFANMDNGTVNVAGKLDASAPKNGAGGFIDTSAAHVKVTDSAKISTKANNGKTGTWIIDPIDFTIAAGSAALTTSSIGASTLSTSLGSSNVSIATDGTTAGNGDIFVNAAVTWSANLLTLTAHRNININANLNGSGTAGLALEYGQGAIEAGNTSNIITKGGSVYLPAGTTNFTTKLGSDGGVKNYTVITSLGAEGSATTTDLQGMNGDSSLNYALGADINASSTNTWNVNEGFMPVNFFTGIFDGLGHTITGLTINRSTMDNVGLFGSINSGSIIRNLGLVSGSIVGQYFVGGLAGSNSGNISNVYTTGNVSGIYQNIGGLVGDNAGGIINNAYATGNVSGSDIIGGLVGSNSGNISNAYATGNVSENGGILGQFVGGLVGSNSNSISNAYATGTVTGIDYVGGLAGNNDGSITNAYATGSVTGTGTDVGGLAGTNNGTLTNTYATGNVSGTATNIGGLVGNDNGTGTSTNSFWNNVSTGQMSSAGGTGKLPADMIKASTFATWDISTIGGSSAVWRIYEGHTTPLLRSFLTSLTLGTALDVALTYNGAIQNGGNLPNTTGVFGTTANGSNVGFYNGYYSNQQYYDLIGGNLTITPANLTLSGTRVYDGTSTVAGSVLVATGVAGETFSIAGAGDISNLASKNVQTGSILASITGLTLNTSSNGGLSTNYNVLSTTGSSVSVTKAALGINAAIDSKTYDGGISSTGTVTYTGLQTGDTLTGLTQAFASKNVLGANGSTLNVNGGYTLTDGNGGLNYTVTAGNAQGTIIKAALGINAATDSKTYDGGISSTGTVTYTGLQTGDTLTGLTQVFASKNVLGANGSTLNVNGYTLNDGNGGLNYTVTAGNAQGTIIKAALGINAATDSKTYDGGTSSTGTVTYTGLQTGDTVTGATQAFTSRNVMGLNGSTLLVTPASYTVNDGNLGGNYTVTENTTTGSITAKALGINAGTDAKTYDGGTSSTGTVTYTGLQTGDTVTGATQAFASKNVMGLNGSTLLITPASYTVNDGNLGSNYTVTENTATGTIAKAALAVTANAVTKTYDGTLAATGKGSVGTITVAGDSVFNTGIQSFLDKNVGINNKTVRASGVTIQDNGNVDVSGNYNITYIDNTTSTINKAVLAVIANASTKTYDGTLTAIGAGSVGTIAGVGESVLSAGNQAFLDKNYGISNKTVRAAGVTIKDSGNVDVSGNYSIIYTDNITSTINKAGLTISANADSKIYDGLAYFGGNGVNYAGLVNGETSAVLSGVLNYGGDAQGAKNVGIYSLTAGGLSSGNYQIAYQNGQLTISPQVVAPVITPVAPTTPIPTVPVVPVATPEQSPFNPLPIVVAEHYVPLLMISQPDHNTDNLEEQVVPLQVSTTFVGQHIENDNKEEAANPHSNSEVIIENGGVRLP